jgi:hypothetical protein
MNEPSTVIREVATLETAPTRYVEGSGDPLRSSPAQPVDLDKPSTQFGQVHNADIDQVAKSLDDHLLRLI